MKTGKSQAARLEMDFPEQLDRLTTLLRQRYQVSFRLGDWGTW